jgi:type IV secretory pathway TrbD component
VEVPNLLHSIVGGVMLFVLGLIAVQWATRRDPQILRMPGAPLNDY